MVRVLAVLVFVLSGCTEKVEMEAKPEVSKGPTLFKRIDSSESGIKFQNDLQPSEEFDVFRYRNFYNGGGVAIGDINNDGLSDVFLTSNMGDNKLYLNKGGWKFEDITLKAGVKGSKVWSTGVSMTDVNGDGFLDIYVCNSGDIKGDKRENELFINNGDLTFSDKAKQYGLDDKGFSTHAVFFDYDKDGDLDCYVLNNSFRPISTLGYKNLRDKRDEMGGDKLFRNDNDFFVDVSADAGIYGSVIGFGLGITVGDVNKDNWPDLYISNDFYERDYLYINNRDGTFSEKLEQFMGHISMFSMGADLADLNNDGFPEIFSTDMLPEDDNRLKTMAAFETYDVYQLRLRNGYYHQFMRNMLQLNNKNGTFSEIGELAGVAATDWSWGVLIADFDNDSHKDIFISNGIYKDVTNQDFVDFFSSNEQIKAAMEGKKVDWKLFTEKMPSQKLSNYMYTRTNDLRYENVSEKWGLNEPSFSNGAAYGDLDNDGDLDLIVNNVNQELFLYQNQTVQTSGTNYLALTFRGKGKNSFGVGASVSLFAGKEVLYDDHMPIRGFQSSMDYKMVIGLGDLTSIDSLSVTWPDETVQSLTSVKPNQVLVLNQSDANLVLSKKKKTELSWLKELPASPIRHRENNFNDFDRDRLLYHMLSTQGPAFAKADLNGDGLDDFFLGGSVGFPGAIYLQNAKGTFDSLKTDVFLPDILSEDVSAVFFDMDGDKDDDLYVVSGGSENLTQSSATLDRLYENQGVRNGKPVFVKTLNNLPPIYQSGSCVEPVDFDNDGDIDLFVGTRLIPSYYGLPANQFLLVNNGAGHFEDKTTMVAPELQKLGMVTDAEWYDFNGDNLKDLIIIGEWMPLTIFENDGKQLKMLKGVKGLEKTGGWWNKIKMADLDMDGDMDFVLGNFGLNSKFKATEESPLRLYVSDFDQNGSQEQIISFSEEGVEYPLALRQDLVKQMNALRKKFVYYRDYAGKRMDEVFDSQLLDKAYVAEFSQANTGILINEGQKHFKFVPLPVEAQTSPVYGIEVFDINNDGKQDIILAGNLFAVKPEVGRYDALHGLVLTGDGKNSFSAVENRTSGLILEGQTRHITLLKTARNKQVILFVRNNEAIKLYTF